MGTTHPLRAIGVPLLSCLPIARHGSDGDGALAMFSSPTDSSFLRAAASQSSIRLKEVRDRLDSVVDYVVDGIITIDDGGLIETLNPAAEKLFNYSAAELIGRSVSLLVSAPRESGDEAEVADEPKIRVAEIAGTGREVVGRRK